MAKKAKHVIFKGHVQGVGFRFTTHRIAQRYDLTGFVRNLPDGTVETLLEGAEEDIKDCISDIRESFSSHIKNAQAEETAPSGNYESFVITH